MTPVDGRVLEVGRVDAHLRLAVKGTDYTLHELLGDDANAERLAGGRFAVIYLSPSDYHRVHAPASGTIRMVRHIAGTLYPVNPFGIAVAPRLFAQNERVVILQETELHGAVVTVLVGALGVGRIGLSFDTTVMTNVGRQPTTKHYPLADAPCVERGEELGVFHLGSTVIIITSPEMPVNLAVSAGDTVRVGAMLAVPARSE